MSEAVIAGSHRPPLQWNRRMSPDDLIYTKEHEWLRIAGDGGIVGITDHAQKELGDIVYIELPKVGTKYDSGETFGSVESVKAVSELYIPVSGEVIEVNDDLGAAPEKIKSYRQKRAARRGSGRKPAPVESVEEAMQ